MDTEGTEEQIAMCLRSLFLSTSLVTQSIDRKVNPWYSDSRLGSIYSQTSTNYTRSMAAEGIFGFAPLTRQTIISEVCDCDSSYTQVTHIVAYSHSHCTTTSLQPLGYSVKSKIH